MLVFLGASRGCGIAVRIALCCAVGTLAAFASGCTAVKPYERGHIVQPCMQVTPNSQAAAFSEHVFEYREGSAGGNGTIGGGCGCN